MPPCRVRRLTTVTQTPDRRAVHTPTMGSLSSASDVDPTDAVGERNDTERAVLGPVSVAEVRAFFSAYVRDRLDSPIARILFRAGRIDVVWGSRSKTDARS